MDDQSVQTSAPPQETPYRLEQIGDFTLKNPVAQMGSDQRMYDIPAGHYPIFAPIARETGDMKPSYAIVYTGFEQATNEKGLLPKAVAPVELEQMQKVGIAQVKPEHQRGVDKAVSLTAPVEQKQVVGASLKR